MRTRLLVIASGLVLAGCSPTAPYQGPPPPPPGDVGYTLSGLVTDQLGAPLVAALVTGVEASGRAHKAQTGVDGRYKMTDLRGQVAVVVNYEFFPPESKTITVTADTTLDFSVTVSAEVLLPAGAVPIEVGQAIVGTVDADVDPFCEPDWDAHSPCRQFVLVPQASEDVRVLLTWVGADYDLELHLINSIQGRLLGIYTRLPSAQIDARVEARRAYEIRVMAYYGPTKFRLSVERR